MMKRLLPLALLLTLCATTALAEVRTPSIFGAHMVLQCDRPVPIWGWADPGEQITVEFAGQKKSQTTAANGQWRVTLEPLAASHEPRVLRVQGANTKRSLRFADVLVGEVWVLGGQSNMGWPLEKSAGGDLARTRADYPWLRIFSQAPNQGVADTPAPDVRSGAWRACRPENAGSISGVGFFFAEALHPQLRVPIALVNTAMGGTWIESWIDPPTLQTLPGARPYEEMIARARAEVAEGKKKLEESMLGPFAFRRPGGLYYGKVAPLQPFAIRGVLWYQGEGNANAQMAPHYDAMLSALIASWRRDWQQGDFPFLIVQLPAFGEKSPAASWPLLREMQLRVSREVKNTGLVVTIDTGERANIHPADKQPVGARAARLACALAYGGAMDGTGPQLEAHAITGGAVTLRFSHVGGGLKSPGGAPKGFEICGVDRKFVPALARIDGPETVSVWSPHVPRPIAVRYAWAAVPECNLLGGDGLPASPGRTDNFAAETAPSPAPGLCAGPGGTVLREGRPYRGIGVNYFDCFLRGLKEGGDTSYEAGFAALAAKGIPFARFCATGFWPRDMALYRENSDEYFRRFDGVVRAAEKQGLGLVPSLFWNVPCVPDLVGEPIDQWGNPASRTHAWMRRYVEEVVTRYRGSPAIWAWEFGNEYNLAIDLPGGPAHRPKTAPALGTPAARTERDELRLEHLRVATVEFARAVRALDPHRLIVTGHSLPRPSAWHLDRERSWRKDDETQFAEALARQNPDPIDALSVHVYEAEDLQRLDWLRRAGTRIGKPVFVGEFGVGPAGKSEAERRQAFPRFLRAILDGGCPLAALWVYDYPRQKEWNVTATNDRAWQLDAVTEANRSLK